MNYKEWPYCQSCFFDRINLADCEYVKLRNGPGYCAKCGREKHDLVEDFGFWDATTNEKYWPKGSIKVELVHKTGDEPFAYPT